MEKSLIDKIKEQFKAIGEVYSIFKKDRYYAVSFKGGSETICVFEEGSNKMEFCSFYDKKGGEISSSWEIIFEDNK